MLWFLACLLTRVEAIDLTGASILYDTNQSKRLSLYARVLQEEVLSRSKIRWAIQPSPQPGPIVELQIVPPSLIPSLQPEGFSISLKNGVKTPHLLVQGTDDRGVLFGVGYLLRKLFYSEGNLEFPDRYQGVSSPETPIRGHQLGYRPKTNSYDAWDVHQWEQYIRELTFFGCNAVELIPPGTDDAPNSPHFSLPPLDMLAAMSKISDRYGLDVWLWFPAMGRDYSRKETVEKSLLDWSAIFARTPRIDALFVPGGDPGGTPPRLLVNLLEKQHENLRRHHPLAKMWVSPQGFSKKEFFEFLEIVTTEKPSWLAGVVYGPQLRISIGELRKLLPPEIPIRQYPDITHSWRCQFPVPDWDAAFSYTLGREPINPRPEDQSIIFKKTNPHTEGFITYSEGCNDDVNKVIWSALGWNSSQSTETILTEYANVFGSSQEISSISKVLQGLENNWRGPILKNESIPRTLNIIQRLEGNPWLASQWRMVQLFYRAYYDAYIQSRARHEKEWENEALRRLGSARKSGCEKALEEAENALQESEKSPAPAWREKVFRYADELYALIGMQLSVRRHQAIGLERGANLDAIDEPLNDRRWLRKRFAAIREDPDETSRHQKLDEIIHWEDTPKGSHYDDLGNPERQPHFVRGPGYPDDPSFLKSSLVSFGMRGLRMSWWSHGETLYTTPLQLKYSALDPKAQYRVRFIYGGDTSRRKVRISADHHELSGFREKLPATEPIEFLIPSAATRDGVLTLSWESDPELGDNGRGCQVAEVWLIKDEEKKK